MRLETLWIGAAALVLAVGCNRSDTQDITGSPQDGNRASMTLTGCLQPGEQGLAPREPNAAANSAENVDEFVLANAQAPGSAASANDATRPLYVLEGRADELRQHVGQQVEIMGRPDDSDESQGNTRRIEVESVRMIAANCATP
jgi:hypothetical protein